MVFQDVVLFDDTVMENIRLGRHGATDEEVLAAAAAANCDEFVEKLPQGYATPIGENGAKLSGGERQRISIARALLKNAPIVLLDEATASLDVENETKVQGALSRLLAGKTVLVIAHRMRTVEAADKIVVLADGKVAEEGSPDELLARENGIFRRMTQLKKRPHRRTAANSRSPDTRMCFRSFMTALMRSPLHRTTSFSCIRSCIPMPITRLPVIPKTYRII